MQNKVYLISRHQLCQAYIACLQHLSQPQNFDNLQIFFSVHVHIRKQCSICNSYSQQEAVTATLFKLIFQIYPLIYHHYIRLSQRVFSKRSPENKTDLLVYIRGYKLILCPTVVMNSVYNNAARAFTVSDFLQITPILLIRLITVDASTKS